MNKVRDIQKLIQSERDAKIPYGPASWHWVYRRSPYIYIANIDTRLSEGDLIVAFSQFGEIVDIKLGRDNHTGKSRGFGWIAYEDPRSTVLAIEGMCGAELLGRTLFVDHALKNHNGAKNFKDNDNTSITAKMSTTKVSTLQSLSIGNTTINNDRSKLNDNGNEGKLTGNYLDDIDDSQFDHEGDERTQRRRMIWDYEAYYIDSDDEKLCEIVYARLKSGEKLVQGRNNTIITIDEYERMKSQFNNDENNDNNNEIGTMYTLDELSKHHNDNDIDSFNNDAITKLTSINDATPHTNNQNKINKQQKQPHNQSSVDHGAMFASIWNQNNNNNNNNNKNDDTHTKTVKMTTTQPKTAEDFAKELGYDSSLLQHGKSKPSLDVLEKLRQNRMERANNNTMHNDTRNHNSSGGNYYDNENDKKGTNYQRDRDRNYQ